MAQVVLGVFDYEDDAKDAIEELKAAGFDTKNISLVMHDTRRGESIAHDTGIHVTGGAVAGATTGAFVGGLAGLLIGVGAITIPGVGALLIGGPLAAALGLTGAAATTVSGAATGAIAGGLLGALLGLGLPEDDAKLYEQRVREGAILVAVPASYDTAEEAMDILEDHDATDIKVAGTKRDAYTNEYYDDEYSKEPARTREPFYAMRGIKGGRRSRRRHGLLRRRTRFEDYE